jgi:hypothetical protein
MKIYILLTDRTEKISFSGEETVKKWTRKFLSKVQKLLASEPEVLGLTHP